MAISPTPSSQRTSKARALPSPLRSDTPNSTVSADEGTDMSSTTLLQMQDLDVGDGNNRANLLMVPHPKAQAQSTTRPVASPSSAASQPLRNSSRNSSPRLRQRRSSLQAAGLDDSLPSTQICQEDCGTLDTVKQETSYCYRHRPDLKNTRQADNFSLESVQQSSQKDLDAMSPQERNNIHQAWNLFSAGSTKQRRLMLRGMLAQCCFPQLSFVAATTREMLKIDFLSALPQELGLKILCNLDSKTLCKAAQVSQTWKSLADDDVIWHRMCEQHIDRKCTTCGWGLPLLDRQKLQAERRSRASRLTQQPLPLPTTHTKSAMSHDEIHQYPDSASDEELGPEGLKPGSRKRTAAAVKPDIQITVKKSLTSAYNYNVPESYFRTVTPIRLRPWKDVYRDRFIIGTNWKHGRCTMKTLKGHTSEVTCLQFDDEIIATGSYDTTIKIWDVETGAILKTLTGHTMGVKCLQFDKSKLVSGSLDGTLKMWDLRHGKVIRTFPGHSGAVVSVHFDGSILASGSQDKTVRVRDFANCSRVSLKGHTDYVNSVRVDAASQTLFSSSDDCTVRVWDLQGKRCIRVLRGHSLQVTQVLPMPCGFELPADLMDEDDAGSANSGDGRTVSVPVAYPRNSPEGRCPPSYILTCSMDSTVRLWEVSSGRCLRTFFGHFEGIWAIAADTLRMISGSNDGCVKIWDPRTGKQERSFCDHSAPVTCVGLSDRRMVTASEDNEIRLYNFSGNLSFDRTRNGR